AVEQARLVRKKAYDRQKQQIQEWNQIRLEGISADMKKMTSINALNKTADTLTLGADEADRYAELVKDGMPKVNGMSNDFTAPARLAIGMSVNGITMAMRAAAHAMDIAATRLEQELEEQQARREARLAELADLAELAQMQTENDLEEIAANLRRIELHTEREIGMRESLIDALRRNLEVDLAHERDLVELKDRRLQAKIRLQESSAAKVRILRAEIVAAQRHMAYMEVVQRAQLLQGRYLALKERLEQLENLIASPSVIFAFSNRLARAESRVERAKGLLYD